MLVLPALDLLEGKCVRLSKGDFATAKVYSSDPVAMLQDLNNMGASFVHIVDLDGAKQGKVAQLELISKLASNEKLSLQVGGGIRDIDDIRVLLNSGVKRVVLGSICVSKRNLVKKMLQEFGAKKIVIALDCQINASGMPIVKTHGWQDDSGVSIWELLDFYHEAQYLLCTDISVDGTLNGPNLSLYHEIQQRYPQLQLIASGGVSSKHDLVELQKMNVYAVVVGRAMYEGKIAMDLALKTYFSPQD